jgi:hypothetical protein
MITLFKNDSIFSDENLKVFQGGDYNYTDLVPVCNVNNLELPLYNFQAHFIKYGYNYESTESFYEKKFKINNSIDSPEFLDYDILGFHKKRTVIKGELKSI